jgi:hypothetical protein
MSAAIATAASPMTTHAQVGTVLLEVLAVWVAGAVSMVVV